MTYYTVVTFNKNGHFFPESFPLTTTDKDAAFREKRRRIMVLTGEYRVIVITSETLEEFDV